MGRPRPVRRPTRSAPSRRRRRPRGVRGRKTPRLVQEDVEDDVAVVEEDPSSGRLSLDRNGAPVQRLHLRFHGVGDRLRLALGCRRTDHEVVGERGNFREIQDEEIGRLLVQGRRDALSGRWVVTIRNRSTRADPGSVGVEALFEDVLLHRPGSEPRDRFTPGNRGPQVGRRNCHADRAENQDRILPAPPERLLQDRLAARRARGRKPRAERGENLFRLAPPGKARPRVAAEQEIPLIGGKVVANFRSVSTVYEGSGRSSSQNESTLRGRPASASASIATRWRESARGALRFPRRPAVHDVDDSVEADRLRERVDRAQMPFMNRIECPAEDSDLHESCPGFPIWKSAWTSSVRPVPVAAETAKNGIPRRRAASSIDASACRRPRRPCSRPGAADARRSRAKTPRAPPRSSRSRFPHRLSLDESTRWHSARQRSTCFRKRMPRPAPSWAPRIRPGMSATTSVSVVAPDDAQIRDERRERIVGDLRARGGNDGDQRRFAGVGKPDDRDVGEQLELDRELPDLAGKARFREARRLPRRRREMLIAPAAVPALGDEDALAAASGRRGFRRIRRPGRSSRRAAGCRHLRPAFRGSWIPGRARPGRPIVGLVPKRIERVQRRRRPDVHVAAVATVAAGRASPRNEFFAPERDASVSAVAGGDHDLGFIDEHEMTLSELRSPASRPKAPQRRERRRRAFAPGSPPDFARRTSGGASTCDARVSRGPPPAPPSRRSRSALAPSRSAVLAQEYLAGRG